MVSSKLGLTEENQEHITLSGIVLNAISGLKNKVSQGIVWELGATIKICRGCDGCVSLATTTFEWTFTDWPLEVKLEGNERFVPG